jgi:hypothetical protein
VKKLLITAITLIAACALTTGAWGQKVYKCGASYSQTPCDGAVTVNAEDPRSKAQKAEADAATRSEAAAANSMEKIRLKAQAQTLADNKAADKKEAAAKAAKSRKERAQMEADQATKTGAQKKNKARQKKGPEYFTAHVAGEKKQKAAD